MKIAESSSAVLLSGASENTVFRHMLIRDNTAPAFMHLNGVGTLVRNATLWSNEVGVHVLGGDISIEDSSISVFDEGNYAYRYEGGTLQADYNHIYVANGAFVAFDVVNNCLFDNVSRWDRDFGEDKHTLRGLEPFFPPTITMDDFHPEAQGGRFDPDLMAYVMTDLTNSPLIDAGNPAADFSNESMPDGGRVNIGLWGNTSEASLPDAFGGNIKTISLRDGGVAEGAAYPLYWVAMGQATGHTVTIEYSPDDGNSWTQLVTGVAASAGVFNWNADSHASSVMARWRITSETLGFVTDTTDIFTLRSAANPNFTFYVNDAGTVGDDYTTAAGTNTASGTTPADPLDSVQAVIDRYELLPGDTILVDAGDYMLSDPITISSLDKGAGANRIRIQGSTNGNPSVFHDEGFVLNGAKSIELSWLTISNATAGVFLDEADESLLDRVTVFDSVFGFDLGDTDDLTVRWCRAESGTIGYQVRNCINPLFMNNESGFNSADGILVNGSTDDMTWRNGLLWKNNIGLNMGASSQSDVLFENTIIVSSGSTARAYFFSQGRLNADFNNIVLQDGAFAGERGSTIYESVSRWRRDFGQDARTLTHDPLFAAASARDFHLQSEGGRWSGGAFVNDAVTSPLIDAGSTNSPFANETAPNGSRANIGLYGNSAEASRSPTVEADSVITAITLNDGGRVEGTNATITWAASGPVVGHTVMIEYSADGGVTWSQLVSGVAAGDGEYTWDTTLSECSPFGRWRITSESNGTLSDETDLLFAVRNCPLSFYVDDAANADDVYTPFNIGSDANIGSMTRPKATVANVLSTYDVEPGDTIFVDTGLYLGGFNVSLFDAGTAVDRVTIQGSTDPNFGTILDIGGSGSGIRFIEAPGMALRYMTITNYPQNGVVIDDSPDALIEWVHTWGGNAGFSVENSIRSTFNHCINRESTGAGLAVSGSSSFNTKWNFGVIWDPLTRGVLLTGGSLSISNTSFGILRTDATAYHFNSQNLISSLTADYNNYWVDRSVGARVLNVGGANPLVYFRVSAWSWNLGQDVHSLSHDPKHADPDKGEFHPLSIAGRFSNGVFVADAEWSPLIDAGAPGDIYRNEVFPNGTRANIGAFGGTPQASRSPNSFASTFFTAITASDGGRREGVFELHWALAGPVSNDTVEIEYSWDAGNTWTTIVTGVAATNRHYEWDSTAGFISSIRG
ncbi:MAG: right-handed parallel beta-helix repeat-containing protein, partial [Verrucomicrobiota bacterium]